MSLKDTITSNTCLAKISHNQAGTMSRLAVTLKFGHVFAINMQLTSNLIMSSFILNGLYVLLNCKLSN